MSLGEGSSVFYNEELGGNWLIENGFAPAQRLFIIL